MSTVDVHPHQPAPRPRRTRCYVRSAAAALLALSMLAACGSDTEVADELGQPSEAEHRAAWAADASRYVELQLDRAAAARS